MKRISLLLCASLVAGCQTEPLLPLLPVTPTTPVQPTTTGTQGTTTTPSTTTPSTTTGGVGTPNVVLPNYATNGFTISNQGLRSTMVTETDASGVPQNMASGTPNSLNVLFRPNTRQLQVSSTKRAFDGTVDAEGVTYSNGSRAGGTAYAFNDSNGQGNGVNQAYLQIGTYAYSGHANLDQDDGRFRHAVSFANGQATADMPTSGFARYVGALDGTAEYTVSTAAQDRGGFVPLSGQSTTEVTFANRSVQTTNVLTDGVTGATIGQLSNNATFSGSSYGSTGGTGFIIVDGVRMPISNARVNGGFAGPNAQETTGIFGASSRSNTAQANRLVVIDGAFLGADPSR